MHNSQDINFAICFFSVGVDEPNPPMTTTPAPVQQVNKLWVQAQSVLFLVKHKISTCKKNIVSLRQQLNKHRRKFPQAVTDDALQKLKTIQIEVENSVSKPMYDVSFKVLDPKNDMKTLYVELVQFEDRIDHEIRLLRKVMKKLQWIREGGNVIQQQQQEENAKKGEKD